MRIFTTKYTKPPGKMLRLAVQAQYWKASLYGVCGRRSWAHSRADTFEWKEGGRVKKGSFCPHFCIRLPFWELFPSFIMFFKRKFRLDALNVSRIHRKNQGLPHQPITFGKGDGIRGLGKLYYNTDNRGSSES